MYEPGTTTRVLYRRRSDGADAVVAEWPLKTLVAYLLDGRREREDVRALLDHLGIERADILTEDVMGHADANLAFYDNTPRVIALHEAMSQAAIAEGGAETNVLWARLMDSTTTTEAGKKGVAKFKELCPSCGIAETEFTTANLDKLATSISAALVSHPDTNAIIVPVDSFVPPVLQGIQSAKFAGKVKVHSSSSDLAGLQRIKDGQQVTDLGTPVLFEGWKFANAMVQLLAGQEVEKGDEFVTRAFTKDNVGELTLDDKTYLSDDWFGGSAYKKSFLTAWGVE